MPLPPRLRGPLEWIPRCVPLSSSFACPITLSKSLPASGFGGFSSDGREYVVTDVHTPRPWINVISNGGYGLVLSQAGGGFSWRSNCQIDRLTRWEQDLATDAWGRFLYLQDLDKPDEVFS